MSSTIRHELNNHLGIIRMLADYLIADHKLPAVAIAKVQEIGNAADHEGSETQRLADYHGWWIERLARRHRLRPIPPDRRLVVDPVLFP